MRRAALAVVALRAAAQPFAPELSHRYLPRTLNASAARPAADAAARLDALVAASGGLGCRSPLAGHRRSGFGSYLRILCHEAGCRPAGRPEPLLQHELLAAGGGRVESGGAACGRRELSGCVVESRFAAAPPQAAGRSAARPQAAERARPRGAGRAGRRRRLAGLGRGARVLEQRGARGLLRPAQPLVASRRRGGLGGAPRPWIGAHVRRGDSCREGAYMGRTCSDGAAYARGLRPRRATASARSSSPRTATRPSRSSGPRCRPAAGPRRRPSSRRHARARGRQDGDKADARIEDLMAAGVVDAAEEFAAVLVDVTVLSDCDAFVGKFTSNLDRLAYALLVFRRQTLAPYASLDTAWSKDTPALYDPAVHGPLQATLAAAEHKSRLRNATRKKLQVSIVKADIA
ncbi:hypothetical protein JL722_7941 [Aureococcus anophagefferens]|nr:hypothetical protein JL722_7941 [Aureococcus anophagefferens]